MCEAAREDLPSDMLWHARDNREDSPFFTRVLGPSVNTQVPPPAEQPVLRWHKRPDGGYLTGHIFVDGSTVDKGACARSGSGVVAMNGVSLVAAISCTVGGDLQTTPVAEMQALWVALAHCLPPAVIHTDHQNIIIGLERGRSWCVAPERPNADWWRRIWSKLDDIGMGPDGVEIVKVKAHISASDVAEGRQTAKDKEGNDAADMFAKLAAHCHKVPRAVTELVDAVKARVRCVGRLGRGAREVAPTATQGGGGGRQR